MNIKDMVMNGKKVFFIKLDKENQALLYRTECGFEFPVSLSDTGEAIFLSEDKASYFMRWINKEIKKIKDTSFVQFVRYQNNEFWYKTESNFEFPDRKSTR